MNMKKKYFSLRLKLNLLIAALILVVATGLLAISYQVFSGTADRLFFERLKNAADDAADNLYAPAVLELRDAFLSDEFQALRREAEVSGNETALRDWMERRDAEHMGRFLVEGAQEQENASGERISLASAYDYTLRVLAEAKVQYGIQSVYLQYDANGETWNLADPDENLFLPGSTEKPIPAFAKYKENVEIPPTIYHSEFGWLCTVCHPFRDNETGEIVCYIGADVDMSAIMHARHSFFLQTGFLVFLLIAASIAFSALFAEKLVSGPLRQLTAAATAFSGGENGYTKDDVISLPIQSRDEIGDLYREIRSMEERIVDYTDHLTHITAERERVSTELRTAAGIQNAMLPSVFPPFPDRREFSMYASMTPAKLVGGDFYDFFFIDEDHLAVLIADVSDKGVPAALFMMASKILLNYRARMGGGPAEILSAINGELCRNNPSSMFVTVWLGILELSTGVLRCCNAGHEKPFLRQNGAFTLLSDAHGPIVGALPGVRYKEYEVCLHPGDVVFVYTDGVPDTRNAAGEFFGLERAADALNAADARSPEKAINAVREATARFAGDADPFDDMTMLCLLYNGPQKE